MQLLQGLYHHYGILSFNYIFFLGKKVFQLKNPAMERSDITQVNIFREKKKQLKIIIILMVVCRVYGITYLPTYL